MSHKNIRSSHGNLRGKHQRQVKAALLDPFGRTIYLQLIKHHMEVVVLLGDDTRLQLKGLEGNVERLQEVEGNHCSQPPLLWRHRWVRLLNEIRAHSGSFREQPLQYLNKQEKSNLMSAYMNTRKHGSPHAFIF